MSRHIAMLAGACLLALAGCGDGDGTADGSRLDTAGPGADGAAPRDASVADRSDAGAAPDAGGLDAAQPPSDASTGHDVGAADAGGLDSAQPPADAAATRDAGEVDAGGVDAGGPFGHLPSPLAGSVVFNEVLTDGTTEGDPNGDGDADPVEDQFVELVNAGTTAVAMDGFTLVDQNLAALPRHTFETFTLAAGHAVVVFGGGDAPPATTSATFFTANAADPGLPFGLNLVTPSSYILLLDQEQRLVAAFCYGDALPIAECALQAAADQSLTRSPDITGGFAPHGEVPGSGGAAFSVGTRVDGTAF